MNAGTQIGAGISVAVAALIAFASIFTAMSSQSSLQTGTDIVNSEKPDAPTPIAESNPSVVVQEEKSKKEKPSVRDVVRVEEEKANDLFSGVTTIDYRSIDRNIFVLVNEQREKAGLGTVNWDFGLAAISGRHSIDMISSGYFDHTDQLGFGVADRYRLGEMSCSFPVTNRNAEGIYRSNLSVLDLDEAAMASMAVAGVDRHAIENPDAERLGAGVALDSEGRLYSTVNLC